MNDLKDYNKEKLTINLVWANTFSILVLIPITLIFGLPYYLIWGSEMDIISFIETLDPDKIALNGLYITAILILGIVVHELIHGIVWASFAKDGFKSIKFGVMWKLLTPYCHCKEALQVKHYLLGALSPAVVLGLIPAFVAIAIGNSDLLLFGIVFTMAAGGDFLITQLLWKEDMNDFVQDHPSEAGCYIYRKEVPQVV